MERSVFQNNLVMLRPGDDPVIGFGEREGKMAPLFVNMDGYAILPMEEYQALLSEKLSPSPPPDPSART